METSIKNSTVIYWSMLYLGILCLLPWDIAVTVSAYWQDKFKPTNFTQQSHEDQVLNSRQKEFETYLNIAAGAASAPIVVMHLFLGHLVSVKAKSLISLVTFKLFSSQFVL